MALSLDRKAFNDIIAEGKAKIGAVMMPGPGRQLGHAAGDGSDAAGLRRRCGGKKPRRGAQDHGRPRLQQGKPLEVKVSTRNIPLYRDPAVILIDQLKNVYVEAELDVIDTSVWFAKVARGDYMVGLNLTGSIDDPDVNLYENYACGSERNYTKYCNPRSRS